MGHQCYTHKILTGRSESFSTLRKFNGLSGFQSMSESIYMTLMKQDYSSTSISAALGYAYSRDISKEKYEVISVSRGWFYWKWCFFEALNQIGSLKSKVIIIIK